MNLAQENMRLLEENANLRIELRKVRLVENLMLRYDYVNRDGRMTCGECHQPLGMADLEELNNQVLETCRTSGCRNNPAN